MNAQHKQQCVLIYKTAASALEEANNTHLTRVPSGIAATSYNAHGVMRQTVHYLIRNCWNITQDGNNPELAIRDIVPINFLLYWNPQHFITQITTHNNAPAIMRNGQMFNIIYVKGTGPANIRTFEQIALSFRAAAGDYALPNYVLVSGTANKKHVARSY